MEIFLIRHTTPLVEAGTCYGQADLDVTGSFAGEAALIRPHLPTGIEAVYASPLMRCSKLAAALFPSHAISYHPELKEISCGEWELQKWNTIPQEVLMPWMNDFVNVRIPGGESYLDLYDRTTGFFKTVALKNQHAALVTHGGVIRSILSYVTSTPLLKSFEVFKIEYGCVVKLQMNNDVFEHTVLHNIKSKSKENKPSYY
jgi:alpha-ribazole phosphatase